MAIQAEIYQLELKTRHTFTISHGSRNSQRIIVVKLEQDGICGYGETSANPYFNHDNADIISNIHKTKHILHSSSLTQETPCELWQKIDHCIPDDNFAKCAINNACFDLWGKLHAKPVCELLSLPRQSPCQSDVTIGIDACQKMIEVMKAWNTWPIFKIKLGTDNDLDIVRAARRNFPNKVIRIDANAAWDLSTSIDMSHTLKDLGVEYIEQPMPAQHWDDMKKLYNSSALPCFADESCITESDVDKCAEHFHGINIKLSKCGGITPALRMIKQAKGRGLKVMIGCMLESTIGISAIGHLTPLLDYVDMDGPQLLGEDIAAGVAVTNGDIHIPNTPGLGITPTRDLSTLNLITQT